MVCGINLFKYLQFLLSFDVRGQGSEVGRHWNDGSLGARARFEEKARPRPLLWIEDLRDEDEGIYRCRVDFKHAPTQNFQINLQVIGKLQGLQFTFGILRGMANLCLYLAYSWVILFSS